MSMNFNMDQEELHKAFLQALYGFVESHNDLTVKPLEVDLKPPLPCKIRLYIFNATNPPGGRTLGEHKIQLIVPGQEKGQYASFDNSGGRIVILAGYQPESKVFILWDAGYYPKFAYSRNIQVKAETVYMAVAGKIGIQKRHVRGQGIETVLTARPEYLKEILKLRMELTYERLLRG